MRIALAKHPSVLRHRSAHPIFALDNIAQRRMGKPVASLSSAAIGIGRLAIPIRGSNGSIQDNINQLWPRFGEPASR